MDFSSALQDLKTTNPGLQISSDPASLTEYGRDWTRYYEPKPGAIAFPKSGDDVFAIVQWARKTKTALVPSGGRTGLSGAAVATKGELVVSFEKMNRVLDFNPYDQTVTVEPGVVTEDLQNFAKEKGLYFPVDFASRGSSQIGGNVSTNAGGIKVIRYGLIRNWITSLKVVTGRGDRMELNKSLVKNATGYDLRQLFIGSEGTLGLVTEVTLKLAQAPRASNLFLLGVADLDAVMKVFELFRAKCDITAFELFTEKALRHVLAAFSDLQKPLGTDAPIYLVVESENDSESGADRALQAFEDGVEKGWILDGVQSQNEIQSKNFWRLREDITEALSKYTPYKNDISVTVANVPKFMHEIDNVFKSAYPDLEIIWFGHIGDGNLHISILKPAGLSMGEFVTRCQKVDALLYSTIQNFGGSISAEHGVGLSKKPFLSYTRDSTEIEYMKAIKKIFDPDLILNPGKIFDVS
ncbi:MAG: FAD-binding oxidoreductase [Bdellovibrionia bacterium]